MESCGGLIRSLDSCRSLDRAPLEHTLYTGIWLIRVMMSASCVLGIVVDTSVVTRLVDWLLFSPDVQSI